MQIHLNRREATWGLRYLLFQLIFLPTLTLAVLDLILPRVTVLTLDIVCWGINFLAVCGIFHVFLWDSAKYSLKNIKKLLLTAVAGFCIYWVLSEGVSHLLQVIYPEFYNVNNANIAPKVEKNFLPMFLATVLLVPLTEEVLYRGVVFGLSRRVSPWLAYPLSVAVFCMIHVSGYVGRYEPVHLLLCFVQYIPAGLVLAGVYEYSGSIYTSTLIHMAVNAIAILSMR